eukprot:3795624-Pleurochrysis_carterae.AAC.2
MEGQKPVRVHKSRWRGGVDVASLLCITTRARDSRAANVRSRLPKTRNHALRINMLRKAGPRMDGRNPYA